MRGNAKTQNARKTRAQKRESREIPDRKPGNTRLTSPSGEAIDGQAETLKKKGVAHSVPSKPSKLSKSSLEPAEGPPQTMEELVAMYGEKIKGFKRGEEVEGKVAAVTGKNIFFDIGGKTEGVVLGKEFEACKDFIKTLKVGDKLKLRVGNPENERGQILLNLRRTVYQYAWDFFEEKLKSQEKIEVRGKELNKGGLIVFAPFNLQGFVPGSQVGSMWQGKHQALINRLLPVKVIEVDRKNNRLVFSERLVSDAEKITAEEKLLKKVKIGGTYEGEVVQVLPYGVMVEVKVPRVSKVSGASRVGGLVHISEISWVKVDEIGKLYQAGDKVKVKVLKSEDRPAGRQDGKLQLSIKQLEPDPWDDLEKKYPKDMLIKVMVTRLEPYGALVELEPGIEGLLHISKIPPDFQIDVGDKISCFTESIDKKGRKISLGLVLKKKPVGYK